MHDNDWLFGVDTAVRLGHLRDGSCQEAYPGYCPDHETLRRVRVQIPGYAGLDTPSRHCGFQEPSRPPLPVDRSI